MRSHSVELHSNALFLLENSGANSDDKHHASWFFVGMKPLFPKKLFVALCNLILVSNISWTSISWIIYSRVTALQDRLDILV